MLLLTPLRAIQSSGTILFASVWMTLCWGVTGAMGQDVGQQATLGQESSVGQPSTIGQPRVEDWVAGLGAGSYLLRLKSEEAILQLGSAAIDPIKQAVNSPDVEISIRARRLLLILLEQDFQRRRKSFLEAPLDAAESFGFSQWAAFAKLVGRTGRTKQLFMAIVQNQRDKNAAQGSSGDVSYLGYLATEQEQYTALPNSAVEVAEELFNRMTKLNSDSSDNNAAPRSGVGLVSPADQPVVIQQLSLSAFEANLPKTLVKTVNESIYSQEIRGLITNWIQAKRDEKGLTGNQIETIFQFELSQLTDAMLKELKNESSKVRLQAAEAIAKTGGPDAIKMLAPFIRGSEVVVAYPESAGGKSLDITLGDIAFQLILKLEDQRLKDFGLLPTAGTMLFSEAPVYGFLNRESANAAIANWESNFEK